MEHAPCMMAPSSHAIFAAECASTTSRHDQRAEGFKLVYGVVTAIRERQGRITLTISFWMFNDMMQIAVPGFQIVDVRLEDRKAEQLLHDSVISNFENELIELLCHRHGEKGSAELSIADRKQLTFLHKYRDIVFEDNGPGVTDENRSKLFTPNFTTKSNGTGLGLSICRNIVEKCEGEIFYSKSFSLKGACFTVRYPRPELSAKAQ